jgi:hypothetical protein
VAPGEADDRLQVEGVLAQRGAEIRQLAAQRGGLAAMPSPARVGEPGRVLLLRRWSLRPWG